MNEELMERTQGDFPSEEVCAAQPDSAGLDNLVGSSEHCVVSFQTELPVPLQLAMKGFIEQYPNWDQYRLIQAALSGFLVQHGVESREITRLYVTNMFGRKNLG